MKRVGAVVSVGLLLVVALGACKSSSLTVNKPQATVKAGTGSVVTADGATIATSATTSAPTTAKGTRTAPYSTSDSFTLGDYNPFQVTSLALGDPVAVKAANPYNDAPTAGQALIRVSVKATYVGTDKGIGSLLGTEISLVGSESKIYTAANITNGIDKTLPLLSDQPDVLAGGVIQGDLYFIIDAADKDVLIMVQVPFADASFIKP